MNGGNNGIPQGFRRILCHNNHAMRRTVTRWLILLFFCHGLIPVAGAVHAAHELAHLSEPASAHVPHHHGQDGAVHHDDSDISDQHMLEHSVAASVAVVPVVAFDVSFVSTVGTVLPDGRLHFYHRVPAVPDHPPKYTFG